MKPINVLGSDLVGPDEMIAKLNNSRIQFEGDTLPRLKGFINRARTGTEFLGFNLRENSGSLELVAQYGEPETSITLSINFDCRVDS